MPPSAERWIVPPRRPELEQVLQRELGIPSLLAAVLVARGFADPASAHRFLHPSLDDLGDPSLLPDFEAGQRAVLGARERGEKIFVHGDYDVDGVTSTALLGDFLRRIGCDVHVHVPHRLREGYGIHLDAVAAAREMGAGLFLTCDCGTSAFEQVRAARAAGMRVVVTDHHHVPMEIPEAEAVINPHRAESAYPDPNLCGVGVAFRFCEGITKAIGWPVHQFRRHFLDLAALGTVADVVPLLGENRILARFGLEQLRATKRVGILALLQSSKLGVDRPIRSWHVAWVLGPRLNAAGRIDDAAMALRLLLTKDAEEARSLAEQLEAINERRKSEQERVFQEAIQRIEAEQLAEGPILLLADSSWHSGIIGIVAGKLAQRFYRPAFVGTTDEDGSRLKFSARSIPGFHLAEAILAHPHLLQGGGHERAAGFSLDSERLDEAKEALASYARSMLSPEDLVPTFEADLEVQGSEADLAGAESLELLQPTGECNREPCFLARGVRIDSATPTRNPRTAMLRLTAADGFSVHGVTFQHAERLQQEDLSQSFDMLFSPLVDEFRGEKRVKWQVRDFRPAEG